MVHSYSSCKTNPNSLLVAFPPPKLRNRGRSTSRNPRSRIPAQPENPSTPRANFESKNPTVEPFPNLTSSVEKESAPLVPNNCAPNEANIPNLNIPIEEASSSSHIPPPMVNPPTNVRLSNKCAALQLDDPQNQEMDDNGYDPISNDIYMRKRKLAGTAPSLANWILDYLENSNLLSTSEKSFNFLTVCCSDYQIWRERNNRRFASKWNSPDSVINIIKNAIHVKACTWKNYNQIKDKFPR
ncbi:hypothetical protein KFK09_004904 [Dendrobium nobile]|uniref:Uncharacterized protein n=1 Tax=Dendrobium nobile TaxID=94219 RepID=A0A8T3BZH2_DENNO|nr:hypothetical protein KFK09_004904 [Dendrobium nobile]